jgi:tetratricopeptide (TPR) repeat protein
MALVHFDAHLDFAFQEVKDVRLIIDEARNLTELKSQLEKAALFRQKQFKAEKLINIGNYIYPAMRDGIVDAFYWVIPGDIGEFRKYRGIIKGLLGDLRKEDPCAPGTPPLFTSGFIKTSLYGRPFCISILDTLPIINRPVLLDIDTDFFIINSLRNTDPVTQIARREAWIETEEFIRTVRKKITDPHCTTIAYSVSGGFVPMVCKTIADELARGLGYRDQGLAKRLIAGEYFRNFREAFNRKDFRSAKAFYQRALKLNSTYNVLDNTYGPLYFQSENYRRAEKEWQGMLLVNGEDNNALSGLGKIRLARKKYREAGDYFAAALRVKPDHKDSLAGLAEVEYHLKNYTKAEDLIMKFEHLEPMQDFSRFLAGKILEKTGRPQEALARYKEALQLGMEHVELLTRLVRLSKRYEKKNLDYLKKRCKNCRKSYLRLEKRILLKKGKMAEVKRMEERFRKVFASLKVDYRH